MKKWPEEINIFLKNNAAGRTTKALTDLVNAEFGTNFTVSQIKNFKSRHRIKSGIGQGIPAGTPTKLYPAEVKEFIYNNYIGIGPKAMADLLNKTFGTSYTKKQIKTYYGRFKLNSGQKGYFPKSHIPHNKGKKGICYPGCIPTQFKKGNKPINWRPVGSERLNVYGYIEIKVAEPNKWRLKHQVIWEEHNGPIPKGSVVIFGDQDRFNFDLNNLLLVSRAQLVRMNQKGLIQNDTELTKTGALVADVMNKIGEVKRKKKGMMR